MTAVAGAEAGLSVVERLWIYQRERFPLGRTALLLAAFTAASINVSAQLADRALPGWPAYAVAFLVALILFFQLRVCDEIKDAEDDRRYRPERPIPRGLVGLPLIVGLGLAAGVVALLAAAALDIRIVGLLALAWLWLALMTAEFFLPDWLQARPFLYLVSHMLIMPLIDLFVTACEWLPASGSQPRGLWLFLLLSFANGCVLEIGRKIYAPMNERLGVETYSALLGPRRAIQTWCLVLAIAFALLGAVGVAVEAPLVVGLIGLVALLACAGCAVAFLRAPNSRAQARIDTAAGLWVLTCYGAAGFAPLLLGVS